jgi:RNase P subunit RPR2
MKTKTPEIHVESTETIAKKDVVDVELMHLAAWKREVVPLEKTTTTQWLTYRVQLARPADGRSRIEHRCQHCGTITRFTVYSTSLLNRAMLVMSSLTVVLAVVGLGLGELSDGPGTALYVVAGFALLFALFAGVFLATIIHFRLRKQGIGFSPGKPIAGMPGGLAHHNYRFPQR